MLEPKFFYRKLIRNRVDALGFVKFDSNPLTRYPALFPGKNSQILQKVIVFLLKRGEEREP